MKHTPHNLGISRLSEANLKAQFEAEQKAMSAHLLGHGSCPACQEEGARLIQESHHLRAVNTKLVSALEPFADIASQFEDLDDDFPVDCVDLGECRRAREAIEEARK